MATTGHEDESINVGGLKSSLQALKTRYIDDLEEAIGTGGSVDTRIATAKSEIIGGATSDGNTLKKLEDRVSPLETAIGSGGSIDTRITNAINALDSSASQTAGNDGLALSVTEENGKITAINGSIAVNTYDFYGSASAAQSAAISAAATDATNKVNAAKSEIRGSATSACDTLGEAEALISAEKTRAQAAEADRYTKSETYTREEVNGIITTPSQQYYTVTATSSTTSVTQVLPTTGAANTIYRVGCWNGSGYTVNCYTEYAWSTQSNAYIKLRTKEYDDLFEDASVPGNGSNWRTWYGASVSKGDKIYAILEGNVTFAGTSETQTFISFQINANGQWLYNITGGQAFTSPTIVEFTADRNGSLYLEGRWHTNENLRLVAYKIPKYMVSLPSKSNFRGVARTLWCTYIKFNNTAKTVTVGDADIINPDSYDTGAGGGRKLISESVIPYNGMTGYTTSDWTLVYNLDNNSYQLKPMWKVSYRDVVFAVMAVFGSSVSDCYYSATIYTYINGNRIGTSSSLTFITRNAHKEPVITSFGKTLTDNDLKPFAFIHTSDIHTKNNGNICLQNVGTFYNYFPHLKCCVITGDIVYDTFADGMDYYNSALNGANGIYLNVIGNHDAGQYNSSVGFPASVGTDKQVYDKFIAPYVDNWGVVQPAGAATDGKSYYYKDFADEKVRLIVLYQFETDYELNEEGTNLKYWREACTVRQAQVNWLIDTLGSTPDDYGVIVAYHIPYRFGSDDNPFVTESLKGMVMGEYTYQSDPQWLEKILTAFQSHSTLNLTWEQTGGVVTTLTANCNFTNNNAEFICILAGHTHNDYIGHPYDFQNLLLLTVGSNNLHYTGRSCARKAGETSEDLFNVVNVDRNRKTVTVIRIGADFSVTGQKRDIITISYV